MVKRGKYSIAKKHCQDNFKKEADIKALFLFKFTEKEPLLFLPCMIKFEGSCRI